MSLAKHFPSFTISQGSVLCQSWPWRLPNNAPDTMKHTGAPRHAQCTRAQRTNQTKHSPGDQRRPPVPRPSVEQEVEGDTTKFPHVYNGAPFEGRAVYAACFTLLHAHRCTSGHGSDTPRQVNNVCGMSNKKKMKETCRRSCTRQQDVIRAWRMLHHFGHAQRQGRAKPMCQPL
ncbi:uncharacterized protein B0I36DRAFT_29827 [Microdochium trichocladiopsis]|uniref:Uncharacterized protein n=1 Tax=Microdochium trichocladiopsis TaxID=1682393 RepID=A0A9P8XZ28_9PEZI|nr:uncharacterized protein B0I36DRAFT_29827 [Microdochium trichocladiopsis]KAH7021188.1 hypothetical protein B0I36DRAFT_29827 [Microdochium trichocladiopsis]